MTYLPALLVTIVHGNWVLDANTPSSHEQSATHVRRPSILHASAPRHNILSRVPPSALNRVVTHTHANSLLTRITSLT
jgi:hypothetical protein